MTDKTTGSQAADKVSALLRARNPLIWIVSKEEARAERQLMPATSTFSADTAEPERHSPPAILQASTAMSSSFLTGT